jgi:PGF-CTERM protein
MLSAKKAGWLAICAALIAVLLVSSFPFVGVPLGSKSSGNLISTVSAQGDPCAGCDTVLDEIKLWQDRLDTLPSDASPADAVRARQALDAANNRLNWCINHGCIIGGPTPTPPTPTPTPTPTPPVDDTPPKITGGAVISGAHLKAGGKIVFGAHVVDPPPNPSGVDMVTAEVRDPATGALVMPVILNWQGGDYYEGWGTAPNVPAGEYNVISVAWDKAGNKGTRSESMCIEIYNGIGWTPTPTPTQPGFEAVFAIVGLLAVAYLVLRRKRK